MFGFGGMLSFGGVFSFGVVGVTNLPTTTRQQKSAVNQPRNKRFRDIKSIALDTSYHQKPPVIEK
jgi:hypothetical protein